MSARRPGKPEKQKPIGSVCTVRGITAADLDQVLELDRATPGAPHWSREAYESCLGPQSGSLRHFGKVAEVAGQVAGFAILRCLDLTVAQKAAGNECELESIVVGDEFRRCGIGFRLLEEMIAEARTEKAVRLMLEVRESNTAAIRLYQRSGLLADGRRPAYYVDPVEDAALMSRRLD